MAACVKANKKAYTTVVLLGCLLLLLVCVWPNAIHPSSISRTAMLTRAKFRQFLTAGNSRMFKASAIMAENYSSSSSGDLSTHLPVDILQGRGTSHVNSTQLNHTEISSENISTKNNPLRSLTQHIESREHPTLNTSHLINSSNSSEANVSRPNEIPDQESRWAINRWKTPPNFPWSQRAIKAEMNKPLTLDWVKALKSYVTDSADTRFPIALVTSNFDYRAALLNWLILSLVQLQDPIKNVLVLSLDTELDDLLTMRNISSIYVPQMATIVKNRFLNIRRVEVARLFAMRLLTHWGHSVVNYDCDALLLRNPQPLFDRHPNSQVIAGAGSMPRNLNEKWGFVLCMGAVLFRPSEQTELLWQTMTRYEVGDDQRKLNAALEYLNITWTTDNTTTTSTTVEQPPWVGHTQANLTITVLPPSQICRRNSCFTVHAGSYYIWHKGGNHDYSLFIRGSRKARLWLLDDDWEELSSGLSSTGRKWLRDIAQNMR